MQGAGASSTAGLTQQPLRLSGSLVACLAFMAGLWAGQAVHAVTLWLWVGGALSFAVAALLTPRRATWGRIALVALALFAAGAAWHDLRLERRLRNSLANLLPAEALTLVQVEGRVEPEPVVGSAQQGRFARFAYQGVATRFTLRARALVGRDGERVPASGRLWVRVDESVYELSGGDLVQVVGVFHPLPPPANPGEADSARAARQFDVVGRLTVSSRASVRRLQADAEETEEEGPAWVRGLEQARTRFRLSAARWLYAGAFDLSDSEARRGQSLVAALVLGERSGESQEVTAAFRRVGLAHLLSISGLHLAILAAVVAFLARCLTSSRRIEMFVVALVVLAYLFLVPARIPVVRASIMVLGFIAAELAGRRYDRLSVLALIALLLLLWRPLELWSPGFQLSFGVVAGLIALGEPARVRLFGERPNPDALRGLERLIEAGKTALAGSLLAWLLASPLVAFHFRTLCPLAALAGLAALPLAGGVLILGYAKILTGALWPSLGQILGPFLALAAELTADLALRVDRLPLASVPTPLLSARWTAFATAAVIYLVVHRRPQRRLALALLVVATVWMFIGSAPPRDLRRSPDALLRLDMLSVGDGACSILRTRQGAYLWDCGSANLLSAGERIIVPALQALGVRRLDGVFLSHPNLDHYSALLAVVEAVPTREVYVTEDFFARARAEPAGPIAYLQKELDERGVAMHLIVAGWAQPLDAAAAVRVTALHPPAGALYERANEGSIVLRVDAGGRALLLTGDVQRQGLAALRAAHPHLRCDVLELPHHGSATEEAAAWLAALDPTLVLQSTSARRNPHQTDVFSPLLPQRAWRVTAQEGAAWVEITRSGEIRSGSYRDAP